MNHYTFDEITVGMEEHFRGSITQQEMEMFRQITGDKNPLHNDDGYALGQGYEDRVVYGMLTASFLSTAAGMYIPGERSLIHEVEVKFSKPLLLSNSNYLDFTIKVVDKHDVFRLLKLKVTASDATGAKVMHAIMKVGVSNHE